MGLEDLLHQKEIKKYKQIAEYYQNLANIYGLTPFPHDDSVAVIADKELARAANSKNPPPISGIKIHAPFSEETKNLLMDYNFQNMLIKGKISGIKIFLFDFPNTRHKWLTIYMSKNSLPYYRELINIFEKNGIPINPQIDIYSDGQYEINRMHISPEKGIFVRYSPYFTAQASIPDIGKIVNDMLMNIKTNDPNKAKIYIKNIDDFIERKYWNKISDDRWRDAEDRRYHRIFVVSRSWLLKNEEILDYLLHNPSGIYTFIRLKEIGRGTIVPDPNIIIEYDDYNKLLEAYDVLDAKIVKYDLSNIDDISRISNHPKERLYEFLKYGTISQ
jgi:hypothetical protein